MLLNKKIIIVIGWPIMGGAQRQALHLARWLKNKEQANVEFWIYDMGENVAKLLEFENISWRKIDWPWAHSNFSKIAKLISFRKELKAAKPDIILPFLTSASLFCGLIWKFTSAKSCYWNQRDEGRDLRFSRIEKFAIGNMTAIISNSVHAAKSVQTHFKVSDENMKVIYNGVLLEKPLMPPNQWREKLNLEEDSFIICMIANLHQYKDHLTLVKAWKEVVANTKKNTQKGYLLFAGNLLDTAEPIKKTIVEFNLEESVKLLGAVNDISGLLSIVDLCAFSSKSEGVPNGVLECMAAGIAVVGTNSDGIREAVGTNGIDYLSPADDPHDLANKIKFMWDNPNIRHEYAQECKKRINSHFSLDRMCNDYCSLLSSSLKK